MAKIKIRKVIQPLDLADYYDDGSESQIIQVWVNPTKGIRDQLNQAIGETQELTKELGELDKENEARLREIGARLAELGDIILGYWSMVWSQHKDPDTHWTPDEVLQAQKDCLANDPGLWRFMQVMTQGMINDYINSNQKKGRRH